MSRFFRVVRPKRSRTENSQSGVGRDAQRGAAIVEHVLLVGLLMITFVGVLTLYTLAIKQVACERIFGVKLGSEQVFTPQNYNNLDWRGGMHGAGCYHAFFAPPLF